MWRNAYPTTLRRLVGGFVLAAALAACGAAASLDDVPVSATEPAPDAGTETEAGSGAVAGMCAAGVTDCVDTPGLEDTEPYPVESDRAAARALLGTAEADLPEDVRVARRGQEQMAVTDDYVLGRLTVALDPAEGGAHVVTEVTVELPDGPETFSSGQ